MVNKPKITNKTKSNTMNSVLTDNKTPPKSKKQIDKEYYQKNKEHKKQQQQERYNKNKERIKAQQKINYTKKKERDQLSIKQKSAKYYGAEAIKVLMSFKEYTELNKEKKKLLTDFQWTLKDCQEAPSVAGIMKLAQVADNLIRDYWKTARNKERKGKSWNSLDYDEQQKLIRYWGYEKARIENGYIDTEERLERKGQEYEKDIELAKFHEERGKIKCDCWSCEESNKIKKEVQKERKKIIDDYEAGQKKSGNYETETVRGECNNCGEYKKVDSDSGICKKCLADYEN